ncbi:MAG: hypothetical protein ACREJU_06365, partial [Nitrospiraceae bacterium]
MTLFHLQRSLISVRAVVLPAMLVLLAGASEVSNALTTNEHHTPVLLHQTQTAVQFDDRSMAITFGPVDLPVAHQGDLAASLPKHIFELPHDVVFIGFQASIFSEDGSALPRYYLHHLLLINTERESLTCPGELYFLAGAGQEMTDARFPQGYGLKLKKGTRLMAIAAFYHDVPKSKGVMASLRMEIAPRGASVKELEAYHIGINVGCYTKLAQRADDEADEGIQLPSGLLVRTGVLRFRTDACVKFAYPHGHDQLVLMTLENQTMGQTLLRTVPNITTDGLLIGFSPEHVYTDRLGFSVNTQDAYQMTMVYHRPLHDDLQRYGMANYVLYFSPGPCLPESDPDQENKQDHFLIKVRE